jgi:hypothetical protein
MTVYAFGLEEHVYDATGTNTDNTYYYTLSGRLIGELHGTTTQFFALDELGSPVVAFTNTANSAQVVGAQLFEPYGSPLYISGSMGTAKGFTGHLQKSNRSNPVMRQSVEEQAEDKPSVHSAQAPSAAGSVRAPRLLSARKR